VCGNLGDGSTACNSKKVSGHATVYALGAQESVCRSWCVSAQVVNARVPSRRYAAVVIDAVSVSRQLSLVAAVALVVVALIHGKLTPARLLALDLGLLMAGAACTCRQTD
jgi:hypothetical protein